MKPTLLLNYKDYYYTPNKALSYNPFFTICMGGRGIGKTTNWTIYAMNNYIRKDEQFIYIRRYWNEIQTYIATDSITKLYKGLALKSIGANAGYQIVNEENKVGYLVCATKFDKFKSTVFDKVTLIIFDEAIIHQTRERRYIADEVIELLNFISTVQRTRTNLRVVLLCNNNDIFNPYFSYFKIPLFEGDYYYNPKRGLLVEHCPINPKLLELEQVTPLYNLTLGTKFAEYHYNNEVLGMKDFNLKPMPNRTIPYICFIIYNVKVYMYTFIDKHGDTKWYCSTEKRGEFKEDVTYELVNESGEPNYYYGKLFKNKFYAVFQKFYNTDRMEFGTQRAGDMFVWILENVG